MGHRTRPRRHVHGDSDRLHVGEAPLLQAGRGESDLRKARDRPLAQLLQPSRRGTATVARERPVLVDEMRLSPLLHDLAPAPTGGASGRTQSYPFSSSASASSLPPERTMRPSARTWTKFGMM